MGQLPLDQKAFQSTRREPALTQHAAFVLTRMAVLCVLLVAAAAGVRADALSDKIDAILSSPQLKHGIQGVVVKSLKSGETLYERNADNAMVPASNMKLLVSATALDRLGPDFTFKTGVYASVPADSKGVIPGSIVLKGGGDPVLLTTDLTNIAAKVRHAGISEITGDLVVDDTLFDSQRLGSSWSWDYLPYYYAPEISALNLNRNVVQVWVRPANTVGAPAEVEIVPANDCLIVHSTATTGAADSKKDIFVGRELGLNMIRVSGSVPQGAVVADFDAEITVRNPSLYAGSVLKSLLEEQGIKVRGSVVSGKLAEGAKLICEHASPPYWRIISLLNKPSDNLIAEVMLKALGAAAEGKGTVDAGADVEREFLKRAGMDLDVLSIADGSGLSRANYVSPRNIANLLTYMHSHKDAKIYIDSLPVAGVDGTLRNRLKNTPAQGKVRAKTGHINRVASLSGYVTTKSGEELVVSMMMNHHMCANSVADAAQNAICVLLAERE